MATQMPTFPSCYKLHPDAQADWQLYQAWLQTYWEPGLTERSAAAPITRLLLWTWDVRKKRLTEVEPRDIRPFRTFLTDPKPKGRWISQRSRRMVTEQWRPFIQGLGPVTTLKNIRFATDLLWQLATWELGDERFLATFSGIRNRRNLTLKQAIKSL